MDRREHPPSGAEHPLRDDASLDPLIERIGDARLVLMGEASHGTHEYYDWRARLTVRLARRSNVRFVAVEADWPDAQRLNRFVRHRSRDASAAGSLAKLDRWPTWMWANEEVAGLGEALRSLNQGRPPADQVGFYGLDLYSLRASLHAVLSYLRERDGALVETAQRAFECIEPHSRPATRVPWVPRECEDEVVAVLAGLQARPELDGDAEARFDAESNAWAALGSERYYRTLLRGDGSWNVRDHHMQDTLARLRERVGPDAVGIVWAHNTHVGDARATDMADAGLINLGQLAREAWGSEVFVLGFGSYEGTVVAARAWEADAQTMPLPRARPASVEARLHAQGNPDRWLDLRAGPEPWREWNGHRAVGVVYHPEAEGGNYVPTRLAERYDAFAFLDRTRALRPLHGEPKPDKTPQTLPWGQ